MQLLLLLLFLRFSLFTRFRCFVCCQKHVGEKKSKELAKQNSEWMPDKMPENMVYLYAKIEYKIKSQNSLEGWGSFEEQYFLFLSLGNFKSRFEMACWRILPSSSLWISDGQSLQGHPTAPKSLGFGKRLWLEAYSCGWLPWEDGIAADVCQVFPCFLVWTNVFWFVWFQIFPMKPKFVSLSFLPWDVG